MNKLLFITYYWPPSGGAGVQRGFKFVKYLPEFNIKPIVLTVDENNASYPVTDYSLVDEIPFGIEIYKTKSFEPLNIIGRIFGKDKIPHAGFANHKKEKFLSKILRFIRGNFFIPDARVGWVKYAYKKACEVIEKEKITNVIISSPPHSSQLIGLKLKKKYPHINWIADLRDPWTDIYYYKDFLHSDSAAARDRNLEREVLLMADNIISVSEEIKKVFSKKAIGLKDKITVIPNGYDEDDFKIQQEISKAKNKFIITYTGTIAEVYNPEIIFRALGEINKRGMKKKLVLRFVGSQSSSVLLMARSYGLEDCLEVIPYVEHSKSIAYLKESDALLLIIPMIENDKGILTGKLFEYLAAKKPIIGIGPEDGDAASIIRECASGEFFSRNPENVNKIISYINSCIDEKINITGNTHTKYSRRNTTKQIVSLLNENNKLF